MPQITERELLALRTRGGWLGELEAYALKEEDLQQLVKVAKIPKAHAARFCECVNESAIDFCQDAQGDIDFVAKYGKQKRGTALRKEKDAIERLVNALIEKLEGSDPLLFSDVLCLSAPSYEGAYRLRNELLEKLTTLQGLCAQANLGVVRGRDSTLLQLYLSQLAYAYEAASGRKVGVSKKDGEILTGPFVKLCQRFFELQPHELTRAIGITPTMLGKAIRNAVAEHKKGAASA